MRVNRSLALLLLGLCGALPASAGVADYNVKVKAPRDAFSIYVLGGYPLKFGMRFADMLIELPDGRSLLDFIRFDDVRPAA